MTGMLLQGSRMLMSTKESTKLGQQLPSLYLRYS